MSPTTAMIRPAFSTVACPEWTLERVFASAEAWGYAGVELRTFGSGSTMFACDPALTAAEKVRRLAAESGVKVATLATGISFDEPIDPPVIGRVFTDIERPQRLGKEAVDLASAMACPLVRVFGFQIPGREKRASAVRRIVQRLAAVVDAARNTGARVVIENGGSFSTAVDLIELMDGVGSPLLGAAYSMPVALAAGEDPLMGAELLGQRLWSVKLKDSVAGEPCPLGEGDLPCRAFVESLAARGYAGWVVYEWDRAWLPDLEEAERVLPGAVERLYEWGGAGRAAAAGPGRAAVMA